MLIIGLVVICCCLLGYAAAHDLAARTVPNWVSAALALLGCVYAALGHHLPAVLFAAFLVFVLGLIAWRFSWMGGGDVKMMAAASLWIQPALELKFVLLVVMAGGLIGLLYLMLSTLVPRSSSAKPSPLLRRILRTECYRIRKRRSIPYAISISTASLVCLLA